jgi:hypothetical protein
MASKFNLTAQINLRGPSNIKPIVADIKRQLGSISANVNVKLDTRSSKGIENITSRLTAMNAILIQSKANAESLSITFQNLSSSLGSIRNSTSNVSASLGKISEGSRKIASETKVARTEMEEFGKQGYLAIKRFAAFSLVSGSIFAVTNAISAAYQEFIKFDKEIVRLQQVTGKGAIGIAVLEKQITSLAINLGVSSDSLVRVASTLAQAGLNAEDTRVALVALAKTELAPSFDDLASTTEGAIATLRQFELQAGDLEAALGSINAVAAAFAVESSDIITAIQRTGGVFASASKGVSQGKDALNEFIAVFTSVRATTRESAETIATGLRTIFTRIQRGKTIDALKDFGIVLTDLEGKFVGPYEAIRRLSEGLKSLDPRDLKFSQIVEELGGFRQIGKVIPLIQQFEEAQKALKIAQTGQSSLTDAQVVAQQSLANQIAKVREQFLALIRDVGKSTAFQGLFKLVLGLTSGLISLASAFKPILPILAVLGTIKGVKAIGEFGSGFFGSMKKGGGSKTIGENLGSSVTGSKERERAATVSLAADAIKVNTDALQSLTTAVNSLENALKSKGGLPKTLNNGGKVLRFQTGGIVPGSGKGDKISALLEPGEVVINNKAADKYGRSNLHKLNQYALGGKIKLTGKEISNTYASLKNKVKPEQEYAANIQPIPETTKSILPRMQKIKESYLGYPNWKLFEYAVAQKHRLKLAGGNKFLDYPTVLGEAKFLPPDAGYATDKETGFVKGNNNETMLAKLIGSGEYKRNATVRTYYPQKINDFRNFSLGGKIQKFVNGGKAFGARSKFKELSSEEISQLSTKDLIAYGRTLAQDIFTTGGAGMAIGNEFIEVPPEKIIPELEPYLVNYLGNKGFWREKIAPFGKPSQKSIKQSSLIDRKTALEAQVTKQADEVAARNQQWTQIREGGEIDKYLLSTLMDPILSDYKAVRGGAQLDKPFYNTRLRQSVNKALEEYDSFDYSTSNIDKLVSGLANKNFANGGKVQKFMAGGVAQELSREELSREELVAWIKELGNPQDIRGLVGGTSYIDSVLKGVPVEDKPASSKEIFTQNFIRGTRSGPYLTTIQELLEIADINKQRPRIFTAEEKANAIKVGLVGMLPFGINDVSYEEIAGKILSIHTATLPKDKAPAVVQMRKEIDEVLGRTNKALYGDPGQNLDDPTKEALGLGNLEGYMIEAILARAGANPGKLDDRSVDYSMGLGRAASLFNIEPNIPTEIKRDVKSGLSKARSNFRNYFAKFSFGGKADGPGFEEVKKQIMDKYPEINFRISKRKAGRGFGYNLLGALKTDGGLLGSKGLKFEQPGNLQKLIEASDKMATSLISPQTFANGGTVPALVSNGEAYVPPQIAKKIGYAKLNKMNQADRNGMKGFSGGGISVFNGPGSGTSDSIGPIGLPQGSYVIREKATKALGLNKGGGVKVKNFASGGSASNRIISLKEQRETERDRKRNLEEQRQTVSSGTEKVLLDEEIKKTEGKINDLTKTIDHVIKSYDDLQKTITQNSQDLDSSNEKLLKKVKEQYESMSGGKKWEDLSDTDKSQRLQRVRAGKYKKGGKDIFETENAAITKEEINLAKSKRKKQRAFGTVSSSTELSDLSLTPKEVENRQKTDTAIIDYRARQQGITAEGFKFQTAQKLGKEAFEIKETYTGRKQEMAAELVTRQDRFKNIGATISRAKIAAKGTGPEAEAAQTQLADANSRLASETENIAQQMRSLNPTLDMDKVAQSASKVAELLSEGQLEEAQKAMLDALGDVPGDAEAMSIAMQRIARDLNIDVGTLERTFDSGQDRQVLERQKFIQSREGQRFGSLAEFAPDLTKRFSESRLGGVLGKGSDFFSGKGGRASQFFANKLGGITGVGAGLTVGAETLKQLLPTSITSNPNAAGALGALGGAGSGAAMGAQLGGMVAGPVGAMVAGIGGAVIGGIQGFFSAKNRAILTNALENVAKTSGDLDIALKKLEQSANDTNFSNAQKAFGDVIAASKPIEDMAMSKPATLIGTSMGMAAGAAVGAAIGSFVPVIGTAIGAGLGALAGGAMSYFSAPSAEQRKEAMGAMVQQSGANQQAASRMAEIQLKKTSTEDLNKMLDSLDQVSSSMDIITEQYAEGMIKAAEATNGQANLTAAQKEKITQDAQERSALDAYMQKRKQSGATDEQITKEIDKDRNAAIKEGREKLKVDNDLMLKQAAMARAVRMVAIESEKLTEVYKRVGGAMDRMSFNIDTLVKNADAFSDTVSGEGKVLGANRTSENILANYSNYSMDEVKRATQDAVGVLGGGEEAKQMAGTVAASKFMEDQLPALLQQTTGQDTDLVMDALRSQLEPMLGADSNVLDQALQQIEERLNAQEGKSIKELNSEELLKELSTVLKSGAETTAKVLKAWNDGIDQAANALNKYNQAIFQQEEYLRKANTIRINAENDLAKALGKNVSLDRLNKAFNEEILSLTKGLGTNGQGTTDANEIGKFIRNESSKFNQGAEFDPSKQRTAGTTKEAVEAEKQYKAAQRASKESINNATVALKRLAEDGSAAANALSKIQERRQLASQGVSFIEQVATAEQEDLANMLLDLTAVNKAASGEATKQDYESLPFRQQMFRGANSIAPLLGEGLGEQLKAKLTLDMLKATNPGLLTETIGLEKDGKKMNIEEALMATIGGEDPGTQVLVKAYNEAVRKQIDAQTQLSLMQGEIAANQLNVLGKIYETLQKNVGEAVETGSDSVRQDSVAAIKALRDQAESAFIDRTGLKPEEREGKSLEEMLEIVRKKGDISQIDALQDLLRRIREYEIKMDTSRRPSPATPVVPPTPRANNTNTTDNPRPPVTTPNTSGPKPGEPGFDARAARAAQNEASKQTSNKAEEPITNFRRPEAGLDARAARAAQNEASNTSLDRNTESLNAAQTTSIAMIESQKIIAEKYSAIQASMANMILSNDKIVHSSEMLDLSLSELTLATIESSASINASKTTIEQLSMALISNTSTLNILNPSISELIVSNKNLATIMQNLHPLNNEPNRSSENNAVPADMVASLNSMHDLSEAGLHQGSIYTHDIHSESLLTDIRDLLSSNSTSVSNRYGSSDIEAINTQFKKLIESLVVSNQNPEGTFINRRNTTPAVASNSISNTISLDEKSSSILNGFIGKFGEYVNQLSQFNFPSKIEIKGNYNMNVNITGAEAFQQMGVDLKAEIEEIYGPAFEYIWKNTNGNLVRRNVSTRNKR